MIWTNVYFNGIKKNFIQNRLSNETADAFRPKSVNPLFEGQFSSHQNQIISCMLKPYITMNNSLKIGWHRNFLGGQSFLLLFRSRSVADPDNVWFRSSSRPFRPCMDHSLWHKRNRFCIPEQGQGTLEVELLQRRVDSRKFRCNLEIDK